MIKMQTELMGLSFKNPVMGASGTFGSGLEYQPFMDLSGLGAIISKGTTDQPKQGNPPPRLMETPRGLLNCIGLQNKGADHLIRVILPQVRQLDTHFIVNISASDVDGYGRLAAKLSVEGVDAIEVNISCPNVKAGGLAFGTVAEDAYQVTRAVRAHTDKPVMVKLSPNVTDICQIARAVEEGGAQAVSLINTLLGMDIDTEKKKPSLSNTFAGLSGPAIKPVGLRMVYQVYQVLSIPIVGLGGIETAQDAIKYLLAGARAVQVGTANFINPAVTLEIVDGIENYLKKHNYDDVAQIVGLAQQLGGKADE